jgi:Zn finger protein HypA/HybF involved in hydrogenase expression
MGFFEWDDFTDYERLGFQWFFADGVVLCLSCGEDMVQVEIADYECPHCGDYVLWGEG